MKRLSLLIPLLLLWATSWGQSVTLSGFVGKFQFSGFSAGGTSDVTGLLDAFSDQTNQYFANQILVGDVVWDNLGNRWEVMAVNSFNLLQADVDLRDINSIGGAPVGVGFVSRETPNMGLSLFVPDNNIGISQQLKSRIESHNMLLIDQYVAANQDSVFSGAEIADTSNVTDPAVGDVLIAGDTLLFFDGDNWVIKPAGTWLKLEMEAGNDVVISSDNSLIIQNSTGEVSSTLNSNSFSISYLPASAYLQGDIYGVNQNVSEDGTTRSFGVSSNTYFTTNSFHNGHLLFPTIRLTSAGDSLPEIPEFAFERQRSVVELGDYKAIPTGWTIGQLKWEGGTSNSITPSKALGAKIAAVSTENYSPTAAGAKLQFFTTANSTTSNVLKLSIDHDGSIDLPFYGTGTFSGTATKLLAVDASGNVIEEDLSGGGSPDGNGIYSGSGNVPDATEATLAASGTFTFKDQGGNDRLKITEDANIAITATSGFTATTTSGTLGLTHTGSTGQLVIQSLDERATFQGEDTRIKGDTILTLDVAGGSTELTLKDSLVQFGYLENEASDFLLTVTENGILKKVNPDTLTQSNGISDGDGDPFSYDFELGGTLEKNTTIDANAFNFRVEDANSVYFQATGTATLTGDVTSVGDADGTTFVTGEQTTVHADDELDLNAINEVSLWSNTDTVRVYANTASGAAVKITSQTGFASTEDPTILVSSNGVHIKNHVPSDGDSIRNEIDVNQDGNITMTVNSTNGRLIINNIPNYADDSAADADGTLPSGGVYTVTGDRGLRIKP